jgi:tripartite-type tricarboxylate transporter receptor subunit TctC
VPYKGTGPAMTDLLGGQVQTMFASIAPLLPHLRAGKLVPLAIADDKRSPLLPEVPTFDELGFDRFEFVNWFGLLAPAGTPSAVIDKLNHDVVAALHQGDVRQVLEAQGLDLRPGTPREFGDFMRDEMAKYDRIVREAKIKAE